MTLIDHLAELRLRLFIAIGAWLVGAGIAFYFRKDLLDLMRAPLPGDTKFIATGLLEQFNTGMQISGFFGLVLASPFIIWQLWAFIAPGLYEEERRWAVPFVLLSALAFVLGVLFCYAVILPPSLAIITNFLAGEVTFMPRIGDYIGNVLLYLGGFGLIFELPVVSFLLARLGVVNARMLSTVRRMAIVVIAIVATVITPTADPVNFFLVALPLYVLYELSVLVVRVSQRKDDLVRDYSKPA